MPRAKTLVSHKYSRPLLNKEVATSPWFIGIDQSSTFNGVAAYHSGLNTVYTTNFLCGKNNVDLIDRLYRLERFLEELISQVKPKGFYTEEIHPGNRHAYAVLLRVETTIHSLLYRNYIPYNSISANVLHRTSWPALLNLKGSKEHIKLALSGIADPLSSEHELDAIGVLMGSLVRDKLFTVNLLQGLNIQRIDNCNDYIDKLRQLASKES